MPRNRTLYAFLLIVTIVAGLATRSTLFNMPHIFGKYPGDSLWAVMMFWGVGLIFPRLSTSRTAGLVILICFVVETIKLLPWDWLNSIRQTTLGHLVLGRAFTWQNYPAYLAGVILASLGEVFIARRRVPAGTSEDTNSAPSDAASRH
jgi:ABC-type branched-subunit amino acid transport system permease subunit